MDKKNIVIHIDPDISDLVPGFLENRHQDVACLHEALKQFHFQTIETLGHNMKGIGAGYGFEDISTLGARIERAAKIKDAETIQACAEELLGYLNRIKIIYG